jgi:hypothetical protein
MGKNMNDLVAFVLFLHRKLGMKRNQLTRIPEGSFQSCGNLGRGEASKSTKFCKKMCSNSSIKAACKKDTNAFCV